METGVLGGANFVFTVLKTYGVYILIKLKSLVNE